MKLVMEKKGNILILLQVSVIHLGLHGRNLEKDLTPKHGTSAQLAIWLNPPSFELSLK